MDIQEHSRILPSNDGYRLHALTISLLIPGTFSGESAPSKGITYEISMPTLNIQPFNLWFLYHGGSIAPCIAAPVAIRLVNKFLKKHSLAYARSRFVLMRASYGVTHQYVRIITWLSSKITISAF